MIKLAIVLPCYNEEEVLRESARRLAGLFGQMEADGRISPDSFMLFVNDASLADRTFCHRLGAATPPGTSLRPCTRPTSVCAGSTWRATWATRRPSWPA